jgi:hypothetical protein
MPIFKKIIILILLFLLYKFDIFNWETLKSLFTIEIVLVTSLLMLVNFSINNFRWYLLLKSQKFSVSFVKIFQISSIGLFFNFVLPSSVGGDVFRILKVSVTNPKRKLEAGFTVIVDRIIGLFSMMLLAFLAISLFKSNITANPSVKVLTNFIHFLFIGGFLFFLLILSRRINVFVEFHVKKIALIGNKLAEVLSAVRLYRHHLTTLFTTIILSLLSQLVSILLFYYMALKIGETYLLQQLLLAVPLGFVASVVPLSPGGIGVGQMAFKFLLTTLSSQPGAAGVLGITVIQFWQLVIGGSVALFSKVQLKEN